MGAHRFGSFEWLETATREELRERLRALEWLLARAPVPLAIAHDAECRFVSANAALARLLGVDEGANVSLTPPPGEVPPYRIQRDGRDLDPDELPMQYAIAHRTSVRNEIDILRGDGVLLHVQNDVEPLYDDKGAVTGCISVCVDVTERKQAHDLLRETGRRKDEFLATLSHELRNPLAPIRTALELLRLAPHDEAIHARALATMQRQLQHLVRLTDDLLDLSRITRDKLELRHDRVELRTVLQAAAEAAQPLVDAAGHTLALHLPDEPIWLDADLTRLAQAFGNLLNNAVKYTDRGGRITVDAAPAGGLVAVTITDTGIGIPPALVPRIFDMFVQLEQPMDRAREGLGIGLTLARRLIELHGGDIQASSEGPGRGTTFTVRLPVGAAHGTQRDGGGRPAAETRTCRILIAEDNGDAAEMLRLMLSYMGHEVCVAGDGLEAVRLAGEFAPQLALLDIGMPRLDGYEAARRIRAARGGQTMLVALTGWGQDEDKARAREAGFDHHLTKPADPDALAALIARAIGLHTLSADRRGG